ncbi:CBS domain-containing protein [Streptomyces sp. A475]|uniref:CBS domain-containing protein n=1 Tax=Streptomyces sp. A475 TaxID=3131976 RepID=UPI0040407366
MTADAECVGEHEGLLAAARKMTGLGVGALPICGGNERLKGVLTDRDIVVQVLGEGRGRRTRRESWRRARPRPSVPMTTPPRYCARCQATGSAGCHVIDGNMLLGMVAQADIARPAGPAGRTTPLEALSTD